MENYYGIAAMGVFWVVVVLMGNMKQKTGMISTFVLRAFAGALGICVVNEILKSQGIAVAPGVNPATVLTVGTLGISGFALIYGLFFYRLL